MRADEVDGVERAGGREEQDPDELGGHVVVHGREQVAVGGGVGARPVGAHQEPPVEPCAPLPPDCGAVPPHDSVELPDPDGSVLEEPVSVFKRNVHVSPFWEEDLVALADLIGEERVLFGSDYPHPEGLREPIDFAHKLEGCDPTTTRKVMRGNTADLLGLTA